MMAGCVGSTESEALSEETDSTYSMECSTIRGVFECDSPGVEQITYSVYVTDEASDRLFLRRRSCLPDNQHTWRACITGFRCTVAFDDGQLVGECL